ncbi:MAG: DUF5596 domain-containing protein [Oscillospiraceae bacterium]|nr:DUF5596 domain-containing protein [Oscillospiraceae bacterium]
MKNTVLAWFDRLPFPVQWRQEVAEAAENFSPDAERTPMWGLLHALCRCDSLERRYEEKGIDKTILMATLGDIVVWAENQYLVHKTVGLSDAAWLEGHLDMKLFRLGRLQFKMESAICGSERYGLKEGDPVIEIHIPQGEPMKLEDVHAAYRLAKTFFAKYFPEHSYRYFTCGSWLLDKNFKDFLKETSNILKFASEFDVIHWAPSNDAMRRLFELNPNKGPENSFQRNVRTFVEGGGQTLEGYGILTWDGWDDDH